MSVIPELAYIQKGSCELLFFAAPPIEGPLNFYRRISIREERVVPFLELDIFWEKFDYNLVDTNYTFTGKCSFHKKSLH